jgi:hypothetical protein
MFSFYTFRVKANVSGRNPEQAIASLLTELLNNYEQWLGMPEELCLVHPFASSHVQASAMHRTS